MRSEVWAILTNQLANDAVSYSRIVQSITPLFWLLLNERVLRYGQREVRYDELPLALSHWLAALPCIAKLMLRLCYHLRATCRHMFLDLIVNAMVAFIVSFFMLIIANVEELLLELSPNKLLLSVMVLIFYSIAAALLWRCVPSMGTAVHT